MSEKLLCEIFKSSRKDEMYLYVDKRKGMETVPEALMETFGKPVPGVKAADVMAAIEEQGFYLQMPPAKEPYLLDIHRAQTTDCS